MLRIACSCAYCGEAISVSWWAFVPSGFPEDIACPACGGCNDISRKSRVLSYVGGLALLLPGLAASKHFGLSRNEQWVISIPLALLGFSLAGALIRKLEKPREPWWTRHGR
jgi:hypothetical protein